jgi:regulatory protein
VIQPKKRLTPHAALLSLQRFCAYQDRCHEEVRSRLKELGVWGNDLELIIVELIEDNFLDEERFAKSYTRGKFRIKNWGKIRIVQELKKRKISDYCIKQGLLEISDDDYLLTIAKLQEKYATMHPELNAFELQNKTVQYILSKGFDLENVLKVILKRSK